jgi:hypothetical protein
MANFTRIKTIWVPVSPTSASNVFSMPSDLMGISDLTFFFINPNPFYVVLDGTAPGGTFIEAAFPGAAWCVKPDVEPSVPYASKQPNRLSARAVDLPSCPLPEAGYDYSNCYSGLVYGRGGNL